MFVLFNPKPSNRSLEDRILAMSDHTVRVTVPKKLCESRLFSELEIDFIVDWLIAYRAHHHLDIIE